MRGWVCLASIVAALSGTAGAMAQDVPGIEICTAEKTMERRTGCLQSNVNFLQQTIGKLRLEQQQRLDTATREIQELKATVTSLQKMVDDLQAAQKAAAAASAKSAPAKETTPAPKDGVK